VGCTDGAHRGACPPPHLEVHDAGLHGNERLLEDLKREGLGGNVKGVLLHPPNRQRCTTAGPVEVQSLKSEVKTFQ